MFYRVIGPMGSGKRGVMLSLAQKAYYTGERVYFIVPEQATACYERELVALLGNRCSTLVEVCNFSRLSNLVLRSWGDLCGRAVTEEEKKILLAQVLKEKRDAIPHLPAKADPDSVDAFYGELEEARQAGLSGEALSRLVNSEELAPSLREKLGEMALVQTAFRQKLEGRFSDPALEEERLCGILEEYPFFQGCTVLLDGFWDFTAPQEALIRRFFSQAKTVAISFVAKKGDAELFERSLWSARRCLRFAREAGIPVEDVTLSPPEEGGALAHLREHLAEGDAPFQGVNDQVSLAACSSPLLQAQFVCDTVLRLVQEGASWKDFAVLTRREETCRVMKWVLEAQGIPLFCEDKKPLAQSPLARTLLLAVQLASLSPREDAVREYLTRGLFLCPREERYLLEKYIATWSPSVRSLLDGKDFVMNPDGYFAKTAQSEAELEAVNQGKRIVFEPLRHLRLALAQGTNEEKVSALVAFLQAIGAEKALHDRLKKEEETGRWEEAGERVRMWNCVLERLSGIARTCGDSREEPRDFYALLTLALSGSLPGQIPPGQDRVHVGLLGFARPEEVKYLFLTDLNAGIFPAPPPKGTLISQDERACLAEYGYALSGGDRAQSEELFLLYLACATPKEKLFLSYLTGEDGEGGKGSLSVFGKRICNLFPDLRSTVWEQEAALPRSREAAFRYVLKNAGREDPLTDVLTEELSRDEGYRSRLLTCLSAPGFEGEDFRLKEELPYAEKDVAMTYSRLETYSKCRFSYFVRYLLEAKAQRKASLGANITGSFVHRVLEVVLAQLAAEGRSLQRISEEELKQLCEKACLDAIEELSQGGVEDPTVAMQLRQIRRSTLLLLQNLQKEFAESAFEPLFFEKELSDLGGAYTLPLGDGTSLCLYGTIDRVDRYVGKNGQEYVRVVDYKTGSQSFRLEDVANGLDLQMLLYLFALWGRPLTPQSTTAASPAGILYLSGMGSSAPCENSDELEKVAQTPFLGLKREGLLVDDPDLLSAQDPQGQGQWIPVAWNRRTPTGKRSLVSMEKLGLLRRKVEADFVRLAEELKGGRIQTNPLYAPGKGIDPCRWCDHRPICKRSDGSRRNYRTRLSEEDIFGKEDV